MTPRWSRPLRSLIDPWLYRHPFEGSSARRYARDERCGFGDLDDRLLAAWAPELAAAGVLVDVGCGPATLAGRVAARHPTLHVVAVDPSRAYTARRRPGVTLVRARAEALPLADGAAGMAVCLSSIRHVADRARALAELRRVVRPGGACHVIELDPRADRARARRHRQGLGSPLLRLAFAPLVMRTAPPVEEVISVARAAGWKRIERGDDPEQPLYRLRLS